MPALKAPTKANASSNEKAIKENAHLHCRIIKVLEIRTVPNRNINKLVSNIGNPKLIDLSIWISDTEKIPNPTTHDIEQ